MPAAPSQRLLCKQRGVSLVLALFILVVLALLGAAMINILSGGNNSVAREVISTRALFVAESGAQRKLSEIFPPGGATSVAACTASTSYSFPGIQGCSNLAANVTCANKPVGGINYFTLTSTGSCGPVGSEATRVVEIQARDGL